jgi:hypothetical protein
VVGRRSTTPNLSSTGEESYLHDDEGGLWRVQLFPRMPESVSWVDSPPSARATTVVILRGGAELRTGSVFPPPGVPKAEDRQFKKGRSLAGLRCSLQNSRGFLERELQPKLDIPAIAGAGELPDSRIANCSDRIPEVRLVPDVERLGPELQLVALAKSEVFQESQVHVVEAGRIQDISTRIPKTWCPSCQSC